MRVALKGKKTLTEIFTHFDNLNGDLSHFNNSNDICTPMGCVKEMVDTIPKEFWHRKKSKNFG